MVAGSAVIDHVKAPLTTTVDFDAPIDRRGTGSNKWSRYPDDVLPMWVADMDFAVAPPIIEAIEARLKHPVLGYAAPGDALRDQITSHLKSAYRWTVEPGHIVFLPGVEPGFNMALKGLLEPGSGVLVQTPVYRPILDAPSHWGLQRNDSQLLATADGYQTDIDDVEHALQSSRALLLCNPHNPTGKVYSRSELEQLAALCLEYDTLIIADEIHCDLLFDEREHTPIASLSPEIARRTVTLMAASKTYNIAGLKTAFAIIPDTSMRKRFNASRLGMVDSVNLFGLESTLAALRDGAAWKTDLINYLQANRDYLVEAVKRRFPCIRLIPPQGTFLAWLDLRELKLPGEAQPWLLERARVAFSGGGEFGAGFEHFVRLNFGCTRTTLEMCLSRMERAMAQS